MVNIWDILHKPVAMDNLKTTYIPPVINGNFNS